MVSAGIDGVEEAGLLHRQLSMFTPGWTCKQVFTNMKTVCGIKATSTCSREVILSDA